MHKIIEQDECYDQKSSMYVLFSALIASIGGILFGYDIGIISGALLQLKGVFSLTAFEQELVVCGVIIGAFCASFVGGNVVDSFGRKAGIVISCGFFIIGSLILCFSVHFVMLLVGRFIVGIGVSLSVTAECTYISEISPPSRRGMMVSFNEVGITTGFLLAYLANYLFISTHNGWKFMFGIAAIPALLQVFGVIFMPSSHHYLIIKGKTDEARKVLKRLRKEPDVEEEIEAIITSVDEQKNHGYLDLFSTNSNMRSRMILGMSLVFFQQFSGNANVLYYAPTVFQHFGYSSDTSATLVSVGLGIIKVLATVITLMIVDRVGRRILLLVGCFFMATSIIILGIVGTINSSNVPTIHRTHPAERILSAINYTEILLKEDELHVNESRLESVIQNKYTLNYFEKVPDLKNTTLPSIYNNSSRNLNNLNHSEYNIEDSSIEQEFNSHRKSNGTKINPFCCNNSDFQTSLNNFTETVSFSTKIISVISLMTFVCAYGMSYGPVTWLVLSEIFPGSLRGRAVSVATCMNWGSNIIVSLTFLDFINAFGIGPTFIIYGFICYGAAIFVFFCLPETKSRTLEEINEILKKGMMRKHWKNGFVFKHRKYSVERKRISNETNGVHQKSDKK